MPYSSQRSWQDFSYVPHCIDTVWHLMAFCTSSLYGRNSVSASVAVGDIFASKVAVQVVYIFACPSFFCSGLFVVQGRVVLDAWIWASVIHILFSHEATVAGKGYAKTNFFHFPDFSFSWLFSAKKILFVFFFHFPDFSLPFSRLFTSGSEKSGKRKWKVGKMKKKTQQIFF